MAGKNKAVEQGKDLEDQVVDICQALGLRVYRQVPMARRIWGSRRRVDVVAEDPASKKRLGIECKFQGTPGSAQEKVYATLADMESWPIAGIVVIGGKGFAPEMINALIATGKVVHVDDLREWLRFFFGLELQS